MSANYNVRLIAVQGEFPETLRLPVSFLLLTNPIHLTLFSLEIGSQIWNAGAGLRLCLHLMKIRNTVWLFILGLCSAVVFAQSVNEDLLDAAKRGDSAAVKSLLAKGADVNARTRYNQTPLMLAADKGHTEIVKLLVEANADVNVTDTFYKSVTALSAAAQRGHAGIVKLLLEKGARGKDNALFAAIGGGHTGVAKTVLDAGGVSQESLDRALGLALERGQSEIAELLKKAGAKPPEQKQLKPEVKVDEATLQKYAGTYRLDEARQYTFVVKDGRLGGWDLRQYSFPLTAIDRNVFRIGSSDDRTIAFNEEDGKITSITVTQSGFKQTYNRVEGK